MILLLLGSTGCVGRQVVKSIVKLNSIKDDKILVEGISAGRNIIELETQIRLLSFYGLKYVYVELLTDKIMLSKKYKNIVFFCEGDKLNSIVEVSNKSDTVFVATNGLVALESTILAAKKGKNIILANKEVLVVTGEILLNIINKKGTFLYPVDSEHSAIWRCLKSRGKTEQVNKLILTASGGPFLDIPYSELKNVAPDQALNHPTWKMGKKISIDSATMVNKGFEIIEAHYFFNFNVDKIDVVIHTESMIHSMIEFIDGSIICQMSNANMEIPIQYALTYPDCEKIDNFINFSNKNLSFKLLDYETKEFLNIFRYVIKRGALARCALCVADEEAIEAFMDGTIRFIDIRRILVIILEKFEFKKANSIEEIVDSVEEYKRISKEIIRNINNL